MTLTKPTAPVLELRDVAVATPTTRARASAELVRGVSLTVGAGELVCVVGESGSGKSVTGKAVLGLARESGLTVSGSIVVDGDELTTRPARSVRAARGRTMALVPQEPASALDPLFRIGDQVAEAVGHARGTGRRESQQVALDLLARVRIPDPAHRSRQYPHELSGGLCQRVAIAMALAGSPRLLVADEPTSALDATVQLHILELLDSVRRDLGTGILLITHDIAVAARADRLVVLYAGSVAEQGPTAQVLADPRHPYTRGLIAAVPAISAVRDPNARLQAVPGTVPSPGNRPDGCVFAPRCSEVADACHEPQSLIPIGGGRESACWRSQSPVTTSSGAAS